MGRALRCQNVELTAAVRIPEVLLVGGTVAGAGKARLLDEGFEQHQPIGVAGLPVIGQSSADQGEDARGEVFAVDSRQDEEAGIAHDEVQVALSLIGRPADDLVPGFDLPSTRAGAKGGDDVAGGAHKVAQLPPGHELVSEVTVLFDIGIPQQRVGLAEHWIDAEGREFDGWDVHGLTDRLLDVRIGPVGDGLDVSRRRQRDQSIGVHAIKRQPAAHVFEPAIVPSPVQPRAHFPGQTGTVDLRDPKQLADQIDLGGHHITPAVLHRSTRVAQAEGMFVGAQRFNRLVKTPPAAPQHGDAGFAITLASEVTAKLAEHAHHLAQRRRSRRCA
jgi:hypothetical protein